MRAGATAAEEGPNKDEDNTADRKSSNEDAKVDSIFSYHGNGHISLAIGGVVNQLIPS